jgi:type IV secretion system protein VirB9
VINTNRRTYHLDLRAVTGAAMAALSWTYPQDELFALQAKAQQVAAATPVARGVDVAALWFGYRLDGDKAAWRPQRVFDDGRQVFIAFPEAVSHGDMPPLFVLGPDGGGELVNYRLKDGYMVVDRLFERAELRLGDKRSAQVVRITRLPAKAGR